MAHVISRILLTKRIHLPAGIYSYLCLCTLEAFSFHSQMTLFMSCTGTSLVLGFWLAVPWMNSFYWESMTNGEAMKKTQPGTGSYYPHCLEGLRLPVEENSPGLTVQYQYLMIKRDVFFNMITCSSRLPRPQRSWLSGGPHQSSKTHLKPSSAHSSYKWEALTQVQTKTKIIQNLLSFQHHRPLSDMFRFSQAGVLPDRAGDRSYSEYLSWLIRDQRTDLKTHG